MQAVVQEIMLKIICRFKNIDVLRLVACTYSAWGEHLKSHIYLSLQLQIRRMIFSGLPVRDLLKCSQVSLLWHQEASAVLSTRKCFAFVRGTCENICTLNSQLESKKGCVINGLSIQIPMDHENCLHRVNEADEDGMTFSRNLVQLPLRHLSFNVSSCEASQQLMEQILLGARHNLEELTLSYDVRLMKTITNHIITKF